jgi:putative DNA methylase
VDFPQAAIGPGMAVFSRYAAVLEPDGSPMTVRSALERINEILDEVLSEQEADFDPTTRFALAWYRQHGYGAGKYGDADGLARARNTAVDSLERYGILKSRSGNVTIYRPTDMAEDYDVVADLKISAWELLHHLIRVLDTDGIAGAGAFLSLAKSRAQADVEPDLVKELGHLLFRVAEQQGWTKDALSFNGLVTSWPDIIDAADRSRPAHQQNTFSFAEED